MTDRILTTLRSVFLNRGRSSALRFTAPLTAPTLHGAR
jgi:hypothetical protein